VTNGTWTFDPRIRMLRIARPIDVDRLLLECGRHLPASFVGRVLTELTEVFSRSSRDASEAPLLPAEASCCQSRRALTLTELTALGGVSVAETYGASTRSHLPACWIAATGQRLALEGQRLPIEDA